MGRGGKERPKKTGRRGGAVHLQKVNQKGGGEIEKGVESGDLGVEHTWNVTKRGACIIRVLAAGGPLGGERKKQVENNAGPPGGWTVGPKKKGGGERRGRDSLKGVFKGGKGEHLFLGGRGWGAKSPAKLINAWVKKVEGKGSTSR